MSASIVPKLKQLAAYRFEDIRRDARGGTLILFAAGFTLITLVGAAAIDYSNAGYRHTRLAAATDSAVLGASFQAGLNGAPTAANLAALKVLAQQYLTANGPSGSTVADFHACLTSGGDCTTAANKKLSVGQIYLRSSDNYTRLFAYNSGLSRSPTEQIYATATANAALWPQTLAMNMTGAKGWYYKTITLYVLPWSNGVTATSYTPLATWTYQPTSLSTASGSSNFTVGTDSANGMTNITASTLGSGYGTLTGPATVTLGQYSNFFLAMNVMQGPCGPSTPWVISTYQNSGAFTGPSMCTATNPNPSPTKSKPTTYTQIAPYYTICTEVEQSSVGSYASYNAICNPNTGSNVKYNANQLVTSGGVGIYDFLYVNWLPQQVGSANFGAGVQNVGLTNMYPCGTTATHQWEDGGSALVTSYSTSYANAINSGTTPSQDLFYSVTTTCAPNAGMAGSIYSTTGSTGGGGMTNLSQ